MTDIRLSTAVVLGTDVVAALGPPDSPERRDFLRALQTASDVRFLPRPYQRIFTLAVEELEERYPGQPRDELGQFATAGGASSDYDPVAVPITSEDLGVVARYESTEYGGRGVVLSQGSIDSLREFGFQRLYWVGYRADGSSFQTSGMKEAPPDFVAGYGGDSHDLAHEVGHAFEEHYDLMDPDITRGIGRFDPDKMKWVDAGPDVIGKGEYRQREWRNPSERAADAFADFVQIPDRMTAESRAWVEARLREAPGWRDVVNALRERPSPLDWVDRGSVSGAPLPSQRFIRYPGQPRDEKGQWTSDGGGNTQSKGLNPRKSRVFAEKVAGDKQADVVGSESVIARRMADEIGFSGLPRVVSRSEMDAAIDAGATEAYRGLSKGEYAEQLRTGSARYSVGTHGSGIYLLCGPDAAAQAAEYATGERWSMAAVRPPTYLGSGVLVRMALVGDAKIIDYEEAAAERYRAGRVYTDEAKRARASGDDDAFARAFAAGDQVADAGLYAMSKGYDAVRFDVRIHQSGVGDIDYPSLIVLNRTALLIQDEDVPVPKAGNRLVAARYPGQPRDEKGQFSTTGIHPLQAAEQVLTKAMPNASIDLSTTIPVDVATINRVAAALDADLARWPEVAPNVTSVRMTDANDVGTSILGVYVKADERGVITDPTTRMAINADEFVLHPRKADFLPDKYVGKDSQGRDVYETDHSATVAEWDIHLGSRVGWSSPGTDLDFVVTHEVGHMVEAAYSPVVLDFMTSLRADYYEGLKPSSELASLGKDPEATLYPNFACRQNVHEWFADLFAMSERGLRPAGYEWQVDRTTELLSGIRGQAAKPYAPVTTRHDPDSRYPGQPRDEKGRWTSDGSAVGEAIEWKDEYSTLLPDSVIPRLETGMDYQSAANNSLKPHGINLSDWLQGKQEEWKAKVGWALAERLGSPEAIAALARSPGLGHFVSSGLDYATEKAVADHAESLLGFVEHDWNFGGDTKTSEERAAWLADPYVRYALTAGFVHQWAVSSGDADALSIAIQVAAAQEFDVPDTITNRYTDPSSSGWREGGGADAYSRANAYVAENGAGLGVILRGIYDATQEGLRNAGVTEIVVTRGITQLPEEVPRVDRLGFGIKVMEDPDGWSGSVTANPLTSWTVERSTARGFGDTHLTTRVPVERVFSTGAFGTGCVLETEVVLLGGEINTFVDRRWS